MDFELFTVARNESYILPYFVKFYKDTIPEIIINVYDNGSTDNTKELAMELGCIVHDFDTNGEIRDDLLQDFKNNIWKNSKAGMVIVVDMDEFIEILPKHIFSTTIVSTKGYDMVGIDQSPDQIVDGVRNHLEDKICCFSPKFIREINYDVGAHQCNPQGYLQWSDTPANLYHFKYLSEEYLINRYKDNAIRLSQVNLSHDWGFHYKFGEDTIRSMYQEAVKNKVKVR